LNPKRCDPDEHQNEYNMAGAKYSLKERNIEEA
jgi:hypothetical protein